VLIWYYFIVLTVSLFLTFRYVAKWSKGYDVYITLIFVFISFAEIAHFLKVISSQLEQAMMAQYFIYISSVYLPVITTACICNICGIHLSKKTKLIAIFIAGLAITAILTNYHHHLFYTSVDIYKYHGATMLSKSYGPLHLIVYAILSVSIIAGIVVLIYSLITTKKIPRYILWLIIVAELSDIVSYFIQVLVIKDIDLLPVAYIITQIVFLLISDRITLYDGRISLSNFVSSSDYMGYVSFDKKRRFLQHNEIAADFIPEFAKQEIDKRINNDIPLFKTLNQWFDLVEQTGLNLHTNYAYNDKIYHFRIGYLYLNKKKAGFQATFIDYTQNQKYLELLNNYNSKLTKDVKSKTEKILDIQNSVLLGIAEMVGSRDSSTGDHIRRTSKVMEILIQEIRKDKSLTADELYWDYLIQASPLHDIGKIAIDDSILRKPGLFTDVEFDLMKSHTTEGARLIHSMFQLSYEPGFSEIAENIAHYHHERWDGSGYPDHLFGKKIPFEARVLALADVLDALVSKRYYKDSMPFEDAFEYMLTQMGRHFDPDLEKYFISCHDKLKDYYSGNA